MQSVYLLSVVMNQLILRSVHTVRQNHILQELEDSTERLQCIPTARCSQECRDHPCPKKDDYSYHLTLPRGWACYSLKILVYDQQSHHFHSLSKHNHSVDIRDTTTAEGSKRYWFHYYPSQCILWHCTEVVQTNWDPTTVMKTINLKNTL